MIVSRILREYHARRAGYESLRDRAVKMLEKELISNSISFHKIESRIKTKKLLEAKIIRKNYKYASIQDITDVVGLRVIVLYEDEIPKIAKIIKKLFDVDTQNSVDKIDFTDPEKFGYRSFHYVVTLQNDAQKFEIQIRTILQHAWAELSHKLGYKSEIEIPKNSLREFSRLSGLLEIGDYAFIKLRNELNDYTKSLKPKNVKRSINIDKESINFFINHDRLITSIDNRVVAALNGTLMANDYFEDELKVAQYLNLKKLSELKSLIKRNNNLIVESAIRTHFNLREKKVAKGIGIVFLGYILADQKGGDSEILNLLNKIELFPPDDRKAFSITLHNRINNYK